MIKVTTMIPARFYIFLFLFGFLVTGWNCRTVKNKEYSSRLLKQTLRHQGYDRKYLVHLPPEKFHQRAMPLLFHLHGGGGTATGTPGLSSGRFNELSNEKGFIVVYPEAVQKNWNDGRKGDFAYAIRENIDDVGFFKKMISSLNRSYSIDMERIFACGMSNGGFMSARLACELPETFRAVGILTATMGVDLVDICDPPVPISVLIMNGTTDPLVPYEGGYVQVLGRKRGKIISTEETLNFWLDKNNCLKTPVIGKLPDIDPKDDTRIESYLYSNCNNDVQVKLYKVIGGGHTWPGGMQYLGERIIGKTSRDINACDVLWEFFEKQ